MAITKIWGIKKTVNKSIAYIINEKKTEGKLLVTSHNCTAELADLEFAMTRKAFDKDNGNLAFHLVQSFPHGEVTEEVAHKIGNELLSRLNLDSHKAVIATHIDKGHIHNHIIFNSVSDDGKRYYDNKKTYGSLRKINDKLCEEYGLGIIEKKEKNKSKDRKPKVKIWENQPDKTNWRRTIKIDIDEAIRESKSFESFIDYLKKSKNYEIKTGKYLSFKPKDKERFVRDRSLGEEYSLEKILNRIELNKFGYKIETFENKSYKKYGKKSQNKKGKHILYYSNVFRFIRKNMLIYNTIFNGNKVKNFPLKYKKLNYNTENINKKIQHLSQQLIFIKKNKIKNYTEILERKKELISKINDIDSVLNSLNKNNNTFNLIYEQLEAYKKYQPYYKNKPVLLKKAYESKYSFELNLYDNAVKILNKYGLTDKDKILEFLDKYKIHAQRLDELSSSKQFLSNDLKNFTELQDTYDGLKKQKEELSKEHQNSKSFEDYEK